MSAGQMRHHAFIVLGLLSALVLPACGGGGGGGAGPDGAGQGLVIVNFLQANVDNVPINRTLTFVFSEPVDPSTIGEGTLQIRQGSAYGLTADGDFVVDGANVYFEPRLPTLCDSSDAGFQPGTTYRITVMGDPEEFSVKNSNGQSLEQTITYEFSTRPESDPGYLEDQIPGQAPAVTTVMPANGEAGVTVSDLNEIVISFSENLDPCSVNPSTVLFQVYEAGDKDVNNVIPAGETNADNTTGFTPWNDNAPDDAYSWGSSTGTVLAEPQAIPAELVLSQTIEKTELIVRPTFGRFPENALCIVDLTFGILDYGGTPLTPATLSFTTQNLEEQSGEMTVTFDSTVEGWPQGSRTADIDTTRSPGLAQGWLLFAGDGDNGQGTSVPSWPIMTPSLDCENARTNDNVKDYFDPDIDVTLNTGSSRLQEDCTNNTDGSQAVVWEFASFRIRNGVTVRIAGENPAILLVQGEVLIESGGRLLAQGGTGGNGQAGPTASAGSGGTGVAGGGDGGKGLRRNAGGNYGGDGYAGFASPSYDFDDTGADEGGVGGGLGSVATLSSGSWQVVKSTGPGAGGGGHSMVGGDGQTNLTANTVARTTPLGGEGGEAYGDDHDALFLPAAGSGGGGSGDSQYNTSYVSTYYEGPGGGGGAGGGFIDITSQGDIRIYGEINVKGGSGGTGGGYYYSAAGGGGGGSGGAIRLLTPADIDLTGGTLSASGGGGGSGGNMTNATANPRLRGGTGSTGRIAMQDGDTLITGQVLANLTPTEGDAGFYRGAFDATRFQGGGLDAEATSDAMLVGPLTGPEFAEPEASDFVCAIPGDAARPPDGTGILIEAAGYPMLSDGTADLSGGDHFYTIGYFYYSGSPSEPSWRAGTNPSDVPVSNSGVGIDMLDGSIFLRFRVRFFVPAGISATTPGPWMDEMTFKFTYDQ